MEDAERLDEVQTMIKRVKATKPQDLELEIARVQQRINTLHEVVETTKRALSRSEEQLDNAQWELNLLKQERARQVQFEELEEH